MSQPLSSPPVAGNQPNRPHRTVTVSSLLPPNDMQLALQAYLPSFGQVRWVDRTGSTNVDLYTQARHSQASARRPWLLGTHLQDSGRGRAGRTWQNRAGANLMFSCAFDVFLPARQLPALSLVAGMAVCTVLRRHLHPEHQNQLTMKWPNDIQWRSAKLAGILVEATRAGTARLAADHHVVIVGMGLNLEDGRALSQALDRRIADWAGVARDDALAASASGMTLTAHIAEAWQQAFSHASSYGLEDLPQRYAAVDALAGQAIDILDDGRLLHTGIARGIDQAGQLKLHNHAGNQLISVGEVSVRHQHRPARASTSSP